MAKKHASRNSLKRFLAGTALALVTCTSFAIMTVDEAYAQRAGRNNDAPAPAEGRQFGAKAGALVNEALQFINAGNHNAALGPLNTALAMEINPYERSTVYQMLGSTYYSLDQYGPSIQNFESAISAGGLLPKESSALRVNIAQLLIGNDQPARGAQMLEDWNRAGNTLKPKMVELLYNAWLQADNLPRALPWAERYFRDASPKERKHYDLLNYLYSNMRMPAKQADIVKQMIGKWPEDNSLWDVWASMLMQGGREAEAFEVSKMLYLGGAYSSEDDLLKIIQYYSYYEMPYQAAQILEREMNAGRVQSNADRLVQLSNLLRQAREYKRAIPVLEKAAGASGKAKLYADLGEALFNDGQCVKSEAAFVKAMDRGFDQGKAWMLIANCRYDAAAAEESIKCSMSDAQKESALWATKRVKAVEAFNNVPASSKEAKNANTWKRFIRAEGNAVQERCDFADEVRKDQCFQAIKASYANVVFAGGFVLEDQGCLEHKEKYDSLYRTQFEEAEE